MFKTSRWALPCLRCRHYSDISSSPAKASAKLVGELRRHTEVSITKAREALAATENDVQRALRWLQEDLAKSGALKAAKVAGRVAGEGVLALSVLSEGWGTRQGAVRAALVELNCETDFVARGEMFNTLAAKVAYTTAYLAEPTPYSSSSGLFLQCFPLDVLNDAPLLSKSSTAVSGTVLTAIQEAVSKVGEKLTVRRAVSLVADPLAVSNAGLRIGSYVHGGQAVGEDAHTGRIASLMAIGLNSPSLRTLKSSPEFQDSLSSLTRAIARQTVGLEARSIRADTPSERPDPESTALYSQPFLMLPGADQDLTIEQVLRSWAKEKGLGKEEDTGVQVLDFARWTAGEGIEKVDDFAEEVKRLSGASAH